MTTVPVLIVGGGGAGLSASMILSTLGVESLLVSGLPTTSILPKAHVLGQRTMEIFTEVGVADEIYSRSTPQANLAATGFYAGVRGIESERGPPDRQARSLGRGEPRPRVHRCQSLPHGEPAADPPGAGPQEPRREAQSRWCPVPPRVDRT